MATVPITRLPVQLRPDQRRTITKPYLSIDEIPVEGLTRVELLIHRVLALGSNDVTQTLRDLERSYGKRHVELNDAFTQGFSAVAHLVPDVNGLSGDMRRLIGAYFMHEYSLEGAALTNPSIVAAPDQVGVADGDLRVIVSMRAVGEGHVSSIEFRSGLLGEHGEIDLDLPAGPVTGNRRSPRFEKGLFAAKLDEMGAIDHLVRRTLDRLEERFTMANLEDALATLDEEEVRPSPADRVIGTMHWLASSNYELTFSEETDISQRVLFPTGPAESGGMEDARFVRFIDPDGAAIYYATYTAFDGFRILPQLIETDDFLTFRIATLNGRAARNKGIAIFPRLVSGQYAALGEIRRREQLLHAVGQHLVLARCRTDPDTGTTLGADADRQLRFTYRDRGRLGGHHSRGRSHAKLRPRCHLARHQRTQPRDRPSQRATPSTG